MNSISCLDANAQKSSCLLSELRHRPFDDLGVTQHLYAMLQGMRESGHLNSPPPTIVRSRLG